MKRIVIGLFFVFLFSNIANADETYERISIFSDVCENVSKNEPVAKTRLKAIDKGVFYAISNLPVLEVARGNLSDYDFNLLIYNIVDNYVENLEAKTVSQSKDKICLKIEGEIKGENIINAVIDAKNNTTKKSDNQNLEIYHDDFDEDSAFTNKSTSESSVTTTVTSTTKTTSETQYFPVVNPEEFSQEHEHIQSNNADESYLEKGISQEDNSSYFDDDYEELEIADVEDMINDDGTINLDKTPKKSNSTNTIAHDDETQKNTLEAQNNLKDAVENQTNSIDLNPQNLDNSKAKIYISDTEFYTGDFSKDISETIKKHFNKSEYFTVTSEKSDANYIIFPKVLRSKIDSINSETGRMQLVVALETRDISENTTTAKYQNRFTLFSSKDDEQEIARNLIDKLFESASEQTIEKIEQKEVKNQRYKNLPKIITPTNPA